MSKQTLKEEKMFEKVPSLHLLGCHSGGQQVLGVFLLICERQQKLTKLFF